MKLAKFSVTTLLLLSVAACGPGGKPPAGGPGAGMPQVSVVTVQPQKITLTTQLPGRTSAFRIAEIRPQVNGLIQKRLFTEGSEIKAGEVLYLSLRAEHISNAAIKTPNNGLNIGSVLFGYRF